MPWRSGATVKTMWRYLSNLGRDVMALWFQDVFAKQHLLCLSQVVESLRRMGSSKLFQNHLEGYIGMLSKSQQKRLRSSIHGAFNLWGSRSVEMQRVC